MEMDLIDLIDKLAVELKNASWAERENALSYMRSLFCLDCGGPARCYCTRDE